MIELTDEQVLGHLKRDTVGRNNQLSILIELLNSNKKSTVVAVDGSWGSGKTVFIRQLCMLGDSSVPVESYHHSLLNDTAIERLRKTQKIFYFNSWANDYIGDALSAVLLNLISEDNEGLNAAAIRRALTMIRPADALKKLSQDAINLNAETKKEKLINNIKEIIDRRKAVDIFLDKLKGDSERIVFIIDELDRCKPSFAVDILEVMKHYFARDDITFILTTNTKELAHTVQKYYGYNFDGYAYLNRFFDYSYHLNRITVEQYTRATLNWSFDSGMVSGVVSNAIDYFKFEMREINSYVSALKLVDNFFNSSRTFVSTAEEDAFVKYLLVPLALALKIKKNGDFMEFVNGTKKGEEILREFAELSSEMKDFAKRIVLENIDLSSDESKLDDLHIEELVKLYRSIFLGESIQNRIGRNLKPFQQVVSLLSSYNTIQTPE